MISELDVFDGRGETVSVSFAKGVAARTVAESLLGSVGLPHKGLEKIPAGGAYPYGFAFIGVAADGPARC